MSAARRVALFGTSANPPTGERGHRGIVRWLSDAWLAELDGPADEIWVLPVYQHAFSSKQDLVPFEERMAMARLAFGDLPKVRILELERDLASEDPSTLALVRAIKTRHPDMQFAWVMGRDTHRDLLDGRWKGSQALLDEVPIIVVRRPGDDDQVGYEVESLEDVSSSQARAGDLGLLHGPVATYVRLRGLYLAQD